MRPHAFVEPSALSFATGRSDGPVRNARTPGKVGRPEGSEGMGEA